MGQCSFIRFSTLLRPPLSLLMTKFLHNLSQDEQNRFSEVYNSLRCIYILYLLSADTIHLLFFGV